MASPTQKQTNRTGRGPDFRKYPPRPPAGAPEVVDPVWLLKALGVVVVAALVCGYGSLCLLLYQGQWQLILHPRQSSGGALRVGGMSYDMLRFGTDESGVPQLTGWAIPAALGARYAGVTVLYLAAGDGSAADAVPALARLHEAGVNVFAFDYRGYGASAAVHPSEARMREDAEWASAYLRGSRGVAEEAIVPYGVGVGGSLAVSLAAAHGVRGVVVDAPGVAPVETVLADGRTRFLPVRWLLHDRFELAGPLAGLKTPKLLVDPGKDDAAFRRAAAPKMVVHGPMTAEFLGRFLDEAVGRERVR